MICSFRWKGFAHMVGVGVVALLLTFAWTSVAVAQGEAPAQPPPQQPPPQQPPPQQPPPQQPPPQQPPPQQPPPQQPPPQQPPPQQPPPQQPQPQQPDTGGSGGEASGDTGDDWPPANGIVSHPATPAQICVVGEGLQYYFIGADGASTTGPYLASFSSLAAMYPGGAAVSLYSGSNPRTGKPVQIHYLPTEKKIKVSTYYPDTQYDTNKPYVFSIDADHTVQHLQW